MSYCTKCGTQLPKDEEARFCPNCGTPVMFQAVYEEPMVVKAKAPKERRVATLKNRAIVMAVVMVICFAVTSIGASAMVDPSEAQDMLQDMDRLEEMLEVAGVQIIFGNNLMHCLIMLIPVVGPFYGSFVLYSTGRVLAAVGSAAGADPLLLFVTLFAFPYAWMEYLSYSLAISESLWLVYLATILGFKGFRDELTNACKVVAICAVLLLLGAFVEMIVISSVPS